MNDDEIKTFLDKNAELFDDLAIVEELDRSISKISPNINSGIALSFRQENVKCDYTICSEGEALVIFHPDGAITLRGKKYQLDEQDFNTVLEFIKCLEIFNGNYK